LTFQNAKDALVNVLGDYWTSALGRITGEDAERLADLAEMELRFGVLAAQGDPRAENLRAHIEAQIVALVATATIVEARELDATLRKILGIGRDVLVEALKIAVAAAMPT
jgi:hypothetical protein